jgi:hypothetical protein
VRHMPTAVRVAIIVGLLISLLILMRQCGSDQGMVPTGVEDQPKGQDRVKESTPELRFYPDVPATLPDLNDGYIFNEERHLEVSDSDAPTLSIGGPDTIDMQEVVYSGSIIVGDLRKALIAYQQKTPVKKRVGRAARSKKQQKAVKGSYKHKQLVIGEVFMGYRVAIIGDNRIVFEKGSEKIEKFLFDAGKQRVVIKSSSSGPQTTKEAASTQVRPPPQGSAPSAFRGRPTATGQAKPVIPQNIRSRRSQRLLGLDPSLVMPPPPGGAN